MLAISDLFSDNFTQYTQEEVWEALSHYYCCDEDALVAQLLPLLPERSGSEAAEKWVAALRSQEADPFSVTEIMARFGLNSEEGVTLLALAEALLRIPDRDTAEALIADKLQQLDTDHLLQHTNPESWASMSQVWGIAIAQQLITSEQQPDTLLNTLFQRLSHSSVYSALKFTLDHLGRQFIFAESIGEALENRNDYSTDNTAFSFDMLGEAAICADDVDGYFNAYLEAIQAAGDQNPEQNTSLSIKLSALHSRLENLKYADVEKHLLHRLYQLLVTARHLDIAITIDAEEADRLELSLVIFEQLLRSEICLGWGKLGLAVQAYSKRTPAVLAWLEMLARDTDTPIPVRLVKGAYWDAEIKHAQQTGLNHYPVYTRKAATDLAYLVCSRFLLSPQCIYLQPQFASHNAATIATVMQIPTSKAFEFQRLHGMGAELYAEVQRNSGYRCRIYAPIGNQQTLLPYLVRRLLENGASASFLFQLHNKDIPIKNLLTPPDTQLNQPAEKTLPTPPQIFLPIRKNSLGMNLGSLHQINATGASLNAASAKQWFSQPVVDGEVCEGVGLSPRYSPYSLDALIGYSSHCSKEQVKQAIRSADTCFHEWKHTTPAERASILYRFAALLENHREEFIALCMREAGKCLQDSVDEIREAVDFCYYYGTLAEQHLQPQPLIAVTGEENTLRLMGRGVFFCISPWNFPLAIFTGQIAAALVCGNTVLAKPASHTSLIAFRACELWYQAGLPPQCLQLVPYPGDQLTSAVLQDTRLSGIAFTGSTNTASQLNSSLAQRMGAPLIPLIAETGGQNAMIADSTALAEQLIKDVIRSAFNSAGQRCSALRVLYLQADIVADIEARLIGAMNTLTIGSPQAFATDIGPVISRSAMDMLYNHIELYRVKGRIIHELPLDDQHNNGYFVPPTLIRLHTLDELETEVFGPVLHLISYEKDNLERVLSEINRCGYGLTLGIHSRNEQFIQRIVQQVNVGNIYINRDQVGAVVGAQPFGGMGLSGTGPKAGGPNYLRQFVREQTLSRNTTASGGNLDLLQ